MTYFETALSLRTLASTVLLLKPETEKLERTEGSVSVYQVLLHQFGAIRITGCFFGRKEQITLNRDQGIIKAPKASATGSLTWPQTEVVRFLIWRSNI